MTGKRFTCENYGLNCLNCPLWNRYSNYCTKFKIRGEKMTKKEVFYPAEEYYKKQNNCEFYLVKTDYKLLMIDDIVRILNNQRETIQYHRKTEKQLEKEHTRLTNQLRLSYDKINKLTDENEQLRNRVKDWHQRTFKAYEYFDILEKVIDEVCNDDISNQIWGEYEKREKLIE